jgi:hypothetical protein
MENGGNELLACPSVTAILMSVDEPMSAAEGMPLSRPVQTLKVAQAGRLAIVNMRKLSSASLAEGRNE